MNWKEKPNSALSNMIFSKVLKSEFKTAPRVSLVIRMAPKNIKKQSFVGIASIEAKNRKTISLYQHICRNRGGKSNQENIFLLHFFPLSLT